MLCDLFNGELFADSVRVIAGAGLFDEVDGATITTSYEAYIE
jgi:hypothetical protein